MQANACFACRIVANRKIALMKYSDRLEYIWDELKDNDWRKDFRDLRTAFWLRWDQQLSFLKERMPSVGSGILIGAGNAVWSISVYWWNKKGEVLDYGVDAVFGVVTQTYFIFVAFALVALIPLFPKLLIVFMNVYDAIVFGLSFLLTNIVIYTVAAFFLDDVPPSAGAVFSTAATIVTICCGFLCFGPLVFDEDLKKISISKERKKMFSHPASWWILYIIWVEVIIIGYTYL